MVTIRQGGRSYRSRWPPERLSKNKSLTKHTRRERERQEKYRSPTRNPYESIANPPTNTQRLPLSLSNPTPSHFLSSFRPVHSRASRHPTPSSPPSSLCSVRSACLPPRFDRPHHRAQPTPSDLRHPPSLPNLPCHFLILLFLFLILSISIPTPATQKSSPTPHRNRPCHALPAPSRQTSTSTAKTPSSSPSTAAGARRDETRAERAARGMGRGRIVKRERM